MPLRTRLSTTCATAAWPASGSERELEIDRLGEAAHLAGAVLGVDQRGVVGLPPPSSDCSAIVVCGGRSIALDVDHDAVGRGRRFGVEGEFERHGRRRAVGDGEVLRAGVCSGASGPPGLMVWSGSNSASRGSAGRRVGAGVAGRAASGRSRRRASKPGPQADERVALGAAVDVREGGRARLQRRGSARSRRRRRRRRGRRSRGGSRSAAPASRRGRPPDNAGPPRSRGGSGCRLREPGARRRRWRRRRAPARPRR